MTEVEILALPVQATGCLVQASDSGRIYHIAPGSTGAAALEIIHKEPGDHPLVVTGLGMTDTSGVALPDGTFAWNGESFTTHDGVTIGGNVYRPQDPWHSRGAKYIASAGDLPISTADVVMDLGRFPLTAEQAVGGKRFKLSGSYSITMGSVRPANVYFGLATQDDAGVIQVETFTAAGDITASGNITLTVTAPGVTGSPVAVTVAVAEDDTPVVWAGKARTALAANAAIGKIWQVGGKGVDITLTRRTAAANESSVAIVATASGASNSSLPITSTETVAGVAPAGVGMLNGFDHSGGTERAISSDILYEFTIDDSGSVITLTTHILSAAEVHVSYPSGTPVTAMVRKDSSDLYQLYSGTSPAGVAQDLVLQLQTSAIASAAPVVVVWDLKLEQTK